MRNFSLTRFSITAIALMFAACSSAPPKLETKTVPAKPPANYQTPGQVDEVSDLERVVWRPQNIVWRNFMLAIGRTAFYIDHVDEKNGEFQVHYSGDPRDYVDCGRIATTVKFPQGDKTYEFAAASPFQQYQIMSKQKVFQVERRMSLDATVRLAMAASDREKTRVRAAATYQLTRDQTVTGAANVKPMVLNDTIAFNTGESGIFPNAATKCLPTGKLEREILSLLK
jgi:hypothetical protein